MAKKIILCCGPNGRAVIIGNVEADPVPGEPVHLTDARMVLYWSSDCGGLLGLAARGPRGSTRITVSVPSITETSWQECICLTEVAAKKVDQWPSC